VDTGKRYFDMTEYWEWKDNTEKRQKKKVNSVNKQVDAAGCEVTLSARGPAFHQIAGTAFAHPFFCGQGARGLIDFLLLLLLS
jgi:hypothetical protein